MAQLGITYDSLCTTYDLWKEREKIDSDRGDERDRQIDRQTETKQIERQKLQSTEKRKIGKKKEKKKGRRNKAKKDR